VSDIITNTAANFVRIEVPPNLPCSVKCARSCNHEAAPAVRPHRAPPCTAAKEVVNWGADKATREFLYVEDCADAIVLAAGKAVGPAPMNLGTGRETSIAELAAAIGEATGFTGTIGWDTSKPDGQPKRYLDVARATERLGFSAKTPLREGIAKTVAWFKANRG
jgi:GDP-L-fucose synthase